MLQLTLLGDMKISLGGEPVSGFISRKVPALFAYLAVTGRPHSRQALAGLLWGESPEGKARASLRTAISDLRRTAEGRLAAYLEVTRQSVAFDRSAPYWLDVAAYTQAVDMLQRQGDEPLEEAQAKRLQQSVALYHGDFLDGFDVYDAPAFEEWMMGERAWMRQSVLQVLYRLSIHFTESGDYRAGIQAAGRLLTLEPWLEEAHRQLMALLALDGRRGAALAQYAACRRILIEELKAEPTAETIDLYERIRDGRYGREVSLIPTFARTHRHNLPPQLTPYFGREEELSQLARLLGDPAYRLVTLVGMGGVGKTRLALAAAEAVLKLYDDGVYFVPLAESAVYGDPRLTPAQCHDILLTAVANELGVLFLMGEEARAQLFNYLRGKRLLLVLDNLEHLVTGASLILDLLRNAPEVSVLVTSRQRLNFQAERAIEIRGLPVPESGRQWSPEMIGTFAGVALFEERAARTGSGFSVTSDNVEQVVEICRLVDGLPLGIELAAAWAGDRPLAQIAESIRRGLDFLATGMADVPERHQNLRAMFQVSWRLLFESEQRCLAQLAVFQGDFEQEAALAVTGDSPADLQRFVDKSLLQRDAAGRYRWHPVLHQLVLERFDSPDLLGGLGSKVWELYAAYYLGFVAKREASLFSRQPQKAAAEILREWDNIQHSWGWAASQGQVEMLVSSMDGLSRFFLLQGLFRQGNRIFEVAADGVRGLESWQLGRLLAERARFLVDLGRFAKGIAVAKEVLDQLGGLEMAPQRQSCEAAARLQWGVALWRQGSLGEAAAQLEQAHSLASRAGSRRLEAESQQHVATVMMLQQDYALGRRSFEEALALHRENEDVLGESAVLNNLGAAALSEGDYAAAQRYFGTTLDLALEWGYRQGQGMARGNLGLVEVMLGDYDRGRGLLEEALSIYREIGQRRGEAEVLDNLARLFFSVGELEAARDCGRLSVELARQLGDRGNEGFGLDTLGEVLLALGRTDEAAMAFQQSLAIFQSLEQPTLATEPRAGLVRVALSKRDLAEAQAQTEEIMTHLAAKPLEGATRPCRVYLACIQLMGALDDPRVEELIRQAHTCLQERAARIDDEALRRSFLERVAEHRLVVEAFEKLMGGGAAEGGT